MSKLNYLLVILLISACGQEPAAEPAPSAAPPEPSAAAPEPAPAPTPAAPEEAAPAEPAPSAAEPTEPAVGTSRTSTGQPTAKKPAAEEVKPPPEEHKAPDAPAASAGPCGEDGQPMCPLQAFMEKNLQGPMDVGQLDAVSQGLMRAGKLAPDSSWNDGPTGWSTIAKAGAAAADAGDEAGTKQSCKSCHKAFRNKYKAEFRTKPL
jgi:hypothetical protein